MNVAGRGRGRNRDTEKNTQENKPGEKREKKEDEKVICTARGFLHAHAGFNEAFFGVLNLGTALGRLPE